MEGGLKLISNNDLNEKCHECGSSKYVKILKFGAGGKTIGIPVCLNCRIKLAEEILSDGEKVPEGTKYNMQQLSKLSKQA